MYKQGSMAGMLMQRAWLSLKYFLPSSQPSTCRTSLKSMSMWMYTQPQSRGSSSYAYFLQHQLDLLVLILLGSHVGIDIPPHVLITGVPCTISLALHNLLLLFLPFSSQQPAFPFFSSLLVPTTSIPPFVRFFTSHLPPLFLQKTTHSSVSRS